MRFGVIVAQGFWLHFREIYAELSRLHQTSVFRERRWPFQLMSARINRRLLCHDLVRFMRSQDVTFFEWSEHAFIAATHLPKSSAIVTRLHSHELWDFAPQADWDRVDAVILVSRAMERKFLKHFPQMTGRTYVIHNGVDLQKFSYHARPFQGVIGTLGRIEPHKRVYDLILVLHGLRQQGLDLCLRVGGTCTEPRYRRYDYEVHALVDRLGLQPYVQFDGFVEDAPAWFREVDIFISHSVSEGLQVALLEAMASGCYCLSHAWDGVEEALPAENIYLSEVELMDKIRAYCSLTPSVQHAYQEQMRAIAVERFDIAQRKGEVCRTIEEVAARAGKL